VVGEGRTESLVDARGVKQVASWHEHVHDPRKLHDRRQPPVAMAGEAPIDCRIVEACSVVQRPEEAREHRPVRRRPPTRGAPRVYVVDIVRIGAVAQRKRPADRPGKHAADSAVYAVDCSVDPDASEARAEERAARDVAAGWATARGIAIHARPIPEYSVSLHRDRERAPQTRGTRSIRSRER